MLEQAMTSSSDLQAMTLSMLVTAWMMSSSGMVMTLFMVALEMIP
jgi:hypothetical protein